MPRAKSEGSREIADAVGAHERSTGALLAVGETIHVNHLGCTAGTDTRRRLYITRKITDSGATTDLGFCHNCGMGAVNVEGTPNARALVSAGTKSLRGFTPVPLELPENLVLAGTFGFPPEAAQFLQPIMENLGPATVAVAGEWDHEDTQNIGIGFNRSNGRLVLPIWETLSGSFGTPHVPEWHTLVGWQERRLYGNGPKYITTDNGNPLETTVHLYDDPPELIVFTEDYLSAIRVAQADPRAMAVPLLRYKVRAERVAELAKTRLPAIVWLDNDRPEVKNEAAHIERLWRAMGNKAAGTQDTLEPKKCQHGLPWIAGHISGLIGEMT